MIQAHFNVLYQPWVPVVRQDGTREELSLLDTLERAPELREISDISPMVEYGLYRLISLFLMDAFRPERNSDLRKMLKRGSFDPEIIDQYVKTCESEGVSFDLFDEKRPFLQTPKDDRWEKDTKPSAYLDCTIPTGNNHTHFDHRDVKDLLLPFAEAARDLPAVQIFCTSGTAGPSNVYGAPPYFCIIRRKNLFETLVFTMIAEANTPELNGKQPVFWRNTETVVPKKVTTEVSWFYGYLYPARRVLLIPDSNCETVSRIYLGPGLNLQNVDIWTDPAVIYHYGSKGRSSVKPKGDKPIWQNLSCLIDIPGHQAPIVLEQAEKLDPNAVNFDLQLYGVETNQAAYVDTVRANVRVPRCVTENEEIIRTISDLIHVADSIGYQVRQKLEKSKAGIPQQKITEMIADFYQQCEAKLWEFCSVKLTEPEPDLIACQKEWREYTIRLIKDQLYAMEASVHLKGESLGRLDNAEKQIWFSLNKIKKEVEE